MYGIHNMDHLLNEASAEDFEALGLSRVQSIRLTKQCKTILEEEQKQKDEEDERRRREEQKREEEAEKKRKQKAEEDERRRREEEDTKVVEDKSFKEKLAAADLGHLWADIKNRFEGDL